MAPPASRVFISYNRADRDWAEWIAGVIERAGYQPIIQAWHFRPGEDFVLRMQEAAAESDMTIAALSDAYLKAEFTKPEWTAAFAQDPTGKKRRLIPVRVAACSLTGMLLPRINIDLVGLGEQDAERALLDGLKPSGRPAQPPPFPGKRAEPSISTAPFPPNIARLHGVPDLPPHYLPREEVLTELKQKLLAGEAVIGVEGMGGIGKTVVAVALARDQTVRQAFPDGIHWLTVGQKPNLLILQGELLRQLTGSAQTVTTEQEGKDALRETLEGRRALVVLDDVWTIDHAYAFSVNALPARLLITTRNNEVLVGLGAEEHRIDVLSPSNARQMLAQWVGEKSPDKLPPEAAEVAKECGYLPLALAMVGAMVRRSKQPPAIAWQDTLECLRASDLAEIKRSFPGYPYLDLLRAIEVSVEALDDSDRERYLDLAVFPEDQPIPDTTLRVLWKLDARRTRKCMDAFAERSLATIAAEAPSAGVTSTLNLHDLQRDLIHKRREKVLTELHLRLVEAWDALPKLPDTYAWRWVAYHLAEAGRIDDLYTLVLDEAFRKAQREKLGQIQPTLGNLQMALNIALARDDLVKVLYCVGAYRDTIRSASIAESIFKAVEAGDCDQALQHTDLYGTASEWTHVLRLYLALEAAESKNVTAVRRAVMAAAQVSLVHAHWLCDALLVRIVSTLAEKTVGTNDARGWLVSFGRSTDAEALLARYRLAEPLDAAQAGPLLTELDSRVSYLEALTQKGASEAISADPFANEERAGDYTKRLRDLFVQLAAYPAGCQCIDRALNAVIINPYPRYRNIALVVLGVAVLAVSDLKWARVRLQQILGTALDKEGATFTFDLPSVLLTEAQRRKLEVPQLTEYLDQTVGEQDRWGTAARARSARAAGLFGQGQADEALKELEEADLLDIGMAGCATVTLLSFANRCYEFGRPELAVSPIWGNRRDVSLLDGAEKIANTVRDPRFKSDRIKLVEAYRAWASEVIPSVEGIQTAIASISDPDARMAYIDHVSARWSWPPEECNWEGIKKLLPLALANATALDAVLGRFFRLRVSQLSDGQVSEAINAYTKYFLTWAQPQALGQWR